MGDSDGTRVLSELLATSDEDDPDGSIRFYALVNLGLAGDPAAVNAILPLLQHEDAGLRTAAAGALQKMHSEAAREALVRVLDDPVLDVRLTAAITLSKLEPPDERAAPVLREGLDPELYRAEHERDRARFREMGLVSNAACKPSSGSVAWGRSRGTRNACSHSNPTPIPVWPRRPAWRARGASGEPPDAASRGLPSRCRSAILLARVRRGRGRPASIPADGPALRDCLRGSREARLLLSSPARVLAVTEALETVKKVEGSESPTLVRAPLRGEVDRRGFLSMLAIGWAAFTTASIAGLGATVRFMFPNVLYEPPQEFKAASPRSSRSTRSTSATKPRAASGSSARRAVSTSSRPPARTSVARRTGCKRTRSSSVPCHGAASSRRGSTSKGPAPRPLERFKVTLAEDGQLLIDKNTKFQEEKGQWTMPGAYLEWVG
jgi:cytochrome b6-f complex iron-sulfur subunit